MFVAHRGHRGVGDEKEYVVWLNTKVGAGVYRLPTEAEWEYATRAGTETRFAQGDELTAGQASFSKAASENVRQHDRPEGIPELLNRRQSEPVDALDAANDWGLRHMSESVFEVTLSCDSPRLLGVPTSSAYLDHALSTDSCLRVAKGGAYNAAMDSLRLGSYHHRLNVIG